MESESLPRGINGKTSALNVIMGDQRKNRSIFWTSMNPALGFVLGLGCIRFRVSKHHGLTVASKKA